MFLSIVPHSIQRLLAFVLLCTCCSANAFSQQAPEAVDQAGKEVEADLQQYLTNLLTGVTLTGYFSVEGAEDKTPKPEHYEILKMTKMQGNLWMIMARIKYGKTDTTVPIVLPVEWAGKTPVITVEKLTIPGMGTFSCHVLFAGDRYAGTWQHGDKGGHLWGTVSKTESSSQSPEAEADSDN